MSWIKFELESPDLAAFGRERFTKNDVSFLGTVRKDGSPRVHPVTPILSPNRLFIFVSEDSPKFKDLQTDTRYQLHSLVEDSDGGNGEFYVRGIAKLIHDDEIRNEAVKASSYEILDEYYLFEFDITFAFGMTFTKGETRKTRWHSK